MTGNLTSNLRAIADAPGHSAGIAEDAADHIEGAQRYATRLATSLWQKHYKEVSPDWKPEGDLIGLLTQIDNMTSELIPAGKD